MEFAVGSFNFGTDQGMLGGFHSGQVPAKSPLDVHPYLGSAPPAMTEPILARAADWTAEEWTPFLAGHEKCVSKRNLKRLLPVCTATEEDLEKDLECSK